MIIGAMQPHFMPGIGYFALMKNVDQFVILDDVQFDKRSWQQRNYFFLNKKENFLTVPVLSKGSFHQKINEVKINKDTDYISKHLRTIEMNYKKTAFFNDIYPNIKELSQDPGKKDYKTRLQEHYAKIGKKVTYENTSTGPDHSKEFSSKVLLSDNVIGTGKGKSKKNAEQMAAKAALLNVKN